MIFYIKLLINSSFSIFRVVFLIFSLLYLLHINTYLNVCIESIQGIKLACAFTVPDSLETPVVYYIMKHLKNTNKHFLIYFTDDTKGETINA